MAKLASVGHALQAIRYASGAQRAGLMPSVRRFVELYRRRRFSPYEIRFNDLLSPRLSDGVLALHASKEELLELSTRHVLDTYLCATMDKALFYSICASAGIAVPRLFAVFDLPSGWAPDGRLLSTRDDWIGFASTLPTEFVVKPALGLLGKGLAAFRHVDDGYADHEGRKYSAGELYDFLCRQADGNLFATDYAHHSLAIGRASHKAIVQERLHAHPAVAELTGSRALCTCRIVTLTGADGRPDVIATAFKAINGGHIADNFDKGSTGNLWCNVDAASGRVTDAFVRVDARDRLEWVDRHPASGRAIVGFDVPGWDGTVALARHAATVFRPQTMIHWDVGIASRGPVVIEGNIGGNLLPTPLNRDVRALLAA
jgi:hypothetical protein